MRGLPYGVRYLIALSAWAGIVTLDIILRIMFIPVMPFFWLWSGFSYTQHGAQLNASTVDFYTRPLMRMPRADWRKLLGRGRGGSANQPAKARLVQDIRNSRI